MKLKHLLIALVAVAVTLGLTGCGKESPNKIVGKWRVVELTLYGFDSSEGEYRYLCGNWDSNIVYEFLSDGTLRYYVKGVYKLGFHYIYDKEEGKLILGEMGTFDVTKNADGTLNLVKEIVWDSGIPGQPYVDGELIVLKKI